MNKRYIAHFTPKFRGEHLAFELKVDAIFFAIDEGYNKAYIKRVIQKHFKPFLAKSYTTRESGDLILQHKCFQLFVEYSIDPAARKADFHYYILSEKC